MAGLTYLSITFLIATVVAVVAFRRAQERRRRKQFGERNVQRCKCGYLLSGLEIPRCPECGRLAGFTKTGDELGISEEEMRAYAAQKKSATKPNGGTEA